MKYNQLFSIGIILQDRDCFNVITLVKKFRLFFSDQEIIIFYSGNKSTFFNELENVVKDNKCVLLFEEENRNIGYARNSIVRRINNPWILMCDGDILLPDNFEENLKKIFQSPLLKPDDNLCLWFILSSVF